MATVVETRKLGNKLTEVITIIANMTALLTVRFEMDLLHADTDAHTYSRHITVGHVHQLLYNISASQVSRIRIFCLNNTDSLCAVGFFRINNTTKPTANAVFIPNIISLYVFYMGCAQAHKEAQSYFYRKYTDTSK